MDDYVKAFIETMAWTDNYCDKRLNYPLQIDLSKKIDMDAVVKRVAADLSAFVPDSDALPGMCFRVARKLSYLLFELQIKHTLTVGDIKLSHGWFVGTDRERIQQELKDGYQFGFNDRGQPIGRPIDAHAWITLENGQILDATVLPSEHRNKRWATQPLSFEESICFFGRENMPTMKHTPLISGFFYHAMVLMHPKDANYQVHLQWINDYFDVMDRLDKSS